MNLFLVVLYVTETNKSNVENAIKRAHGWWHYFDSVWVISTARTLAQWQNRLRELVSDDERFLIVDIKNQERDGWLPSKAWTWLSDQERGEIAQNKQ